MGPRRAADIRMMADGSTQAGSRPQDFREAIAQWRLAVHTEVKATSALPTAMFDASDPMLEMQLAETAEAMLAQLHMPAEMDTHEAIDTRRLEDIDPAEMRALPTRIGAEPTEPVDLLSNLAGEYLGILADCCTSQTGLAQVRAAHHLCHDFGVRPDDLGDVLGEMRRLAAAAPGEAGGFESVIAEVVATVRRLVPDPEDHGA